jgi:NADH-quinone oxidoreductase subunit H
VVVPSIEVLTPVLPLSPLALALETIPWLSWLLWLLVGFALVFPGIVAYMVWGERKIAARFQDRIGPNRIGPFGLLVPIADAVKLVTKEDIVPRAADKIVHLVSPCLLLISAMLVLAVVPFGFGRISDNRLTGLAPIDLPSSLLYLIAVSSISALGVFLAGWSSRNKYSLLGAMRAVAQLVSYEVPQVLATVPVILWAGSLNLAAIVDHQVDQGWFLFSPPGLVAFIILTIANIAEVNRSPFDLPEAESEIIAGYHTEYSGMRFGLFFLAEYMSVFGVSCLGTCLFLGGGALPFTSFPKSILTDSPTSIVLVNLLTVGIFAAKVILYIFFMFWVRATLPRIRVDRLMGFAWKALVPVAIINILIAAVWYELVVKVPVHKGWGIFNLTWLWGTFVTGLLVIAAILLVRWFNRIDAEVDLPPTLTPARPRRRTPPSVYSTSPSHS